MSLPERYHTVLYMECRPVPSLRVFGHVVVLCTFKNIPAAAVAGIARRSQLNSSLAGQVVRPAHQSTNNRPPTTLLQLGRAGRRAGSVYLGSMCTHSCTHWLRPRNPPPPLPPHLGSNTRALLVCQDRRHLFVSPWFCDYNV